MFFVVLCVCHMLPKQRKKCPPLFGVTPSESASLKKQFSLYTLSNAAAHAVPCDVYTEYIDDLFLFTACAWKQYYWIFRKTSWSLKIAVSYHRKTTHLKDFSSESEWLCSIRHITGHFEGRYTLGVLYIRIIIIFITSTVSYGSPVT